MKVLRIIFSKWSISALIFLVQVAAIVVLALLAAEYFVWFQVVATVVGILVFFAIINRQQNTDYKIPWLFLVLALPLFGTLFYLMFGQNRMRKKDYRFLVAAQSRIEPLIQEKEGQAEQVDAYLGGQRGIEHYLKSTSGAYGFLGNDVKYYPVGELMWKDMLEALKGAKKFILMEYFIVDPGIMWDAIHQILVQKAKEGVKVHFMYDDVGTVTMLPSSYYKQLRKEGIDAHKFNPFRPIASNIYNNRDHRKITVVDGEVAFTGGINLGDEYINENHRLGHWKDTGLRIIGPAIASLMAHFFFNFGLASKEELDYAQYFPESFPKPLEEGGYINFFGDGPTPYYPDEVGEGNYINMINAAKETFYITTPYLIIDYRFTTALRDAAMRGVDVRIVTPHIPDKKAVFAMTRSSYAYLRKAGVKIYEYTPGFIHAKMAVTDGKLAFVGTINMDFRSLTHHYECGAVIAGCECVKDINEDFRNIFEASQFIDDSFKLSFGARLINAILAVFRALF